MSQNKIPNKDQPYCITIKGDMTIYTALIIKNKFLEAYATSQPIEVDLSGVTEMDVSGGNKARKNGAQKW